MVGVKSRGYSQVRYTAFSAAQNRLQPSKIIFAYTKNAVVGVLRPLQDIQHEDFIRNIEIDKVNQDGIDLLVTIKIVSVSKFD